MKTLLVIATAFILGQAAQGAFLQPTSSISLSSTSAPRAEPNLLGVKSSADCPFRSGIERYENSTSRTKTQRASAPAPKSRPGKPGRGTDAG